MATIGAGDLMEAIKVAQSISEAETASLREQQSREWLEREAALRLVPDLPADVVMISDTEEAPVGQEIVPLGEENALSWLAIKDQVVDWADDIHEQLSRERFCCITVEIRAPHNKSKPDHIVEAMEWLVRFGQGTVTDAWTAVKPEHRCAQFLTEDGCHVRFVFADMDAVTHPSLSLVVKIGRVAYCDAIYDCGSVNDHVADAGYKIPNLKRGQKMIIAQVPACNPMMKHSKDMNTVHKARFVLVHLIWAYDEEGESELLKGRLP